MHGFAMAGVAPREKRSNQNYKDEHLGSWPVYVRRCEPADWLVSKQRAPSHELVLHACSQPMDMQKRSDVTDKYRYVAIQIIQQNTMCLGHNSLWYAFVTVGDVVILPAGSQQGLGMGPSLLSPT